MATTQLTPKAIWRPQLKTNGKKDSVKQNSKSTNVGTDKNLESTRDKEKGTLDGENDENDDKNEEHLSSISVHDQAMSVQAARACVMLNAKELVASLGSAWDSLNPKSMNGKVIESNKNDSNSSSNSNDSSSGSGSSGSSNEDGSGSGGDDTGVTPGIWGGLHGGGLGSNMQQFILVGKSLKHSAIILTTVDM